MEMASVTPSEPLSISSSIASSNWVSLTLQVVVFSFLLMWVLGSGFRKDGTLTFQIQGFMRYMAGSNLIFNHTQYPDRQPAIHFRTKK